MDIYSNVLKFWDGAFEMDNKEKDKLLKEIDPENGWKKLAPSEKLRDVIIQHLSGCSKVLDYGCGRGWAGIILSMAGCKDVTCVDVSENAVAAANTLGNAYGVTDGFKAECVSTDWIKTEKEGSYDGIFCSNVIDVLPPDAAKDIIENISRIAAKDAKIIIAMNYCRELTNDPEKNMEVKNGREVYINGVLRLILRTDDEWAEIFSERYVIEKIDHFAWPGEAEETRRIFVMKNK